VFSWVIFQRVYHPAWADKIPYVVAVIQLKEGPRLISNIVGCDPSAVFCGMPVEVSFERVSPEMKLPVFRPRSGLES
jgi:uncharacterized OB-fold protein